MQYTQNSEQITQQYTQKKILSAELSTEIKRPVSDRPTQKGLTRK